MDYIENIKGSDSLELNWGKEFRGWEFAKIFNRTEMISLGDNLNTQVKVCDYQYRFILPEKIEFFKGIGEEGKVEFGVITYTEPERLLGVFRYPQNQDGFFKHPIAAEKTVEDIINMDTDQLKNLIDQKKVLTFEAFRIPYFGFQYFSITDEEFDNMGKNDVITSIQSTYVKELKLKISEIQIKIKSLPNYLLILQNVLDLKWKNEAEISTMTGGLIHFGI